jgi:hypothetical protein
MRVKGETCGSGRTPVISSQNLCFRAQPIFLGITVLAASLKKEIVSTLANPFFEVRAGARGGFERCDGGGAGIGLRFFRSSCLWHGALLLGFVDLMRKPGMIPAELRVFSIITLVAVKK